MKLLDYVNTRMPNMKYRLATLVTGVVVVGSLITKGLPMMVGLPSLWLAVPGCILTAVLIFFGCIWFSVLTFTYDGPRELRLMKNEFFDGVKNIREDYKNFSKEEN